LFYLTVDFGIKKSGEITHSQFLLLFYYDLEQEDNEVLVKRVSQFLLLLMNLGLLALPHIKIHDFNGAGIPEMYVLTIIPVLYRI